MNIPRITKSEFVELQKFVDSALGIQLTEAKMVMVEQRIRPLVTAQGHATFHEYITKTLLQKPSSEVMTAFVDRITTNHTYFWRENEHFQLLQNEVLPQIVQSIRSKSLAGTTPALRMWCCAASRGHEPYTLAMIQQLFFKSEYENWSAGLLATDISDKSLKTASLGLYDKAEVQKLPLEMQHKFFTKRPTGELEVNQTIKSEVVFRKFNLKQPTYIFRRPFEIIFCRNVLIYFDAHTTAAVVRKLSSQLTIGGYLFVGLAESLGRETDSLKYIRPGLYRKMSS